MHSIRLGDKSVQHAFTGSPNIEQTDSVIDLKLVTRDDDDDNNNNNNNNNDNDDDDGDDNVDDDGDVDNDDEDYDDDDVDDNDNVDDDANAFHNCEDPRDAVPNLQDLGTKNPATSLGEVWPSSLICSAKGEQSRNVRGDELMDALKFSAVRSLIV
ncbi:hypothetical protein T265_10818 [Opisthorchis viverrini]|uniref:Uncharacterized protein n=1 Tax=Opisthorchis viverrini TaxID=6198 RepID=A0A074Z597_OPIVI|nr:hypothetical protein T265_10818 [Opisthorchis viverrini]KER20687.1 hypothetical protein T265_10818 [Opisthorchis viverrini]